MRFNSLEEKCLYYRGLTDYKITPNNNIIVMLDGKNFSTLIKNNFKKPFDDDFINMMNNTATFLCENVQGCKFAYTQSDEITLILIDYQSLNTSAWFDYEVQKMCSVSASMATMIFNKLFSDIITDFRYYSLHYKSTAEDKKYADSLLVANNHGAMFDSRCFNIPKEEVTNLIYWRQLDATRNSIQSVGQHYFTQKELHCKSCAQIQDMLMEQKGINWNDLDTTKKRGCCCIKYKKESNGVESSEWIIDNNIPIFKGVDREYIERLI
jgi:tRNA(His) 5'-end guanylyltransferase